MLLKLVERLFSGSPEKRLAPYRARLQAINAFEPTMQALSDEALSAQTGKFRVALEQGAPLDSLIPEVFATVREVASRTLGMRPFDVQMMGAMVLHEGKIAEMKTGEGKTLVATLPIYLNALSGKGAHVVTVNDYLAKRDSEWMGKVYRFLGLDVGTILSNLGHTERQQAYAADVTYGTNNEFGFDYLRDNMATDAAHLVQRDLHYAIVDEVDSILVDEARTPLIISGQVEQSLEGFYLANRTARQLKREEHFTVDEKTKNAVLTEEGIHQVETVLGLSSLFDFEHMDLAHQIVQALRAWHLFRLDVDYVIKDGEIVIVDEFTGRLMVGRRYSDGLHQAIEAKENVQVRQESQTLATITFQNFFRMYQKLAGMTGTAATEAAEFEKIYGLDVMEIPTNRPMVRTDHADVIYRTQAEKFKAIVEEVVDCHKRAQPVLVGTISIENSEKLSSFLRKRGTPHHVLNAKYHEKEAEIIARAGQPGAVTIATNMAGRGTDIVLGEGVTEKGGLRIIGSERHESRRIDNQLRGRSGRQGDPGESRFYVSMEDHLMRLFGSDRISGMMQRLGMEEGVPIEHRLVTRALENAQRKVEEHNFSIRKQLLEYDDVMNRQRQTVYQLRRRALTQENLREKYIEMIGQVVKGWVDMHLPPKSHPDEWNLSELKEVAKTFAPLGALDALDGLEKRETVQASLTEALTHAYEKREAELGEIVRNVERHVLLRVIDGKWIDHLHSMDALRDGIGLRAYGQRDPLVEYKIEGYQMFQEMTYRIAEEALQFLFKVQVTATPVAPLPPASIRGTHSSRSVPPFAKPAPTPRKVGRNDPCPCGSGKKYKKCHGTAATA